MAYDVGTGQADGGGDGRIRRITSDGLVLDVNISMLFAHLPMSARPDAVAAAGFGAVEVWWPFETAAPSAREIRRFADRLRQAGTQLVAINMHEGNPRCGDRGSLSWPHETAAVLANAELTLDIAATTGCRLINALYGNAVPGLDVQRQREVAVDNLTHIARLAAERDVTIILETLNGFDSPGFPLTRLETTGRLVTDVRKQAGVDNVALLFDVYHLHRTGHDLVGEIGRWGNLIAHVQLADDPGRGRPGSGVIDFPAVLAALARSGYRGCLGLEYIPEPDALGGLHGNDDAA
jgi:hydroxypyruvate isomerase